MIQTIAVPALLRGWGSAQIPGLACVARLPERFLAPAEPVKVFTFTTEPRKAVKHVEAL